MSIPNDGIYAPSGAMLHLASHFTSRGFTADHLEQMHPHLRAHYSKLAGLNNPSEEGWNALVDHVRRSSGQQAAGRLAPKIPQ